MYCETRFSSGLSPCKQPEVQPHLARPDSPTNCLGIFYWLRLGHFSGYRAVFAVATKLTAGDPVLAADST
ncbi:uncharacterized protein PG998_011934 [Apiospora kogelbergensis]|uniref:uncharacterized protein n=1 Tax=Apiospora kogelbergensis TaxID=1337665 RepID=UPI00312DA680